MLQISKILPAVPFHINKQLLRGSPDAQYQMSHKTKAHCRIRIGNWVSENRGDPSLKDFRNKLKMHLLFRLQGEEYDGNESAVTAEELQHVVIVNDTIFCHKVLQVNYTMYDLRQEQDSLNPRTHADVMLLAHPNRDEPLAHPYCCRILTKSQRFVDQDMFMCFCGGRIGHKATREATDFLLNDWPELDLAQCQDPGFEPQEPQNAVELANFSTIFERNNPKVNLGIEGELPVDFLDEYESASEDSSQSDVEGGSEQGDEDPEDLGAEDGEEEDEVNANGYAAY
ncbi:hypothetical protein EST38_g11472 [Candolleomyces aberdarensis]|uniref:Uncharacterized protein n=1 Tax=Candolleomyces aberdarensis TaxID=2316362 RepID=A0A4Q2D831_9AGAR|nr:hypothetical protein EST38_g11472 [Candolleomyces aberdarensis]